MTERKPKVSVVDGATPSATLIAAAATELTVKEGARTFTLRKPGILAQVALIRVLGEDAKNEVLREIYAPLTYLKAIDGELIPQPQTQAQLDALLARVEDAGLVAIMTGVVKHFGQPDVKAHQDAVKN